MNDSRRFPKEFEEPFRDALDHAAKRRTAELRVLRERLTAQQVEATVGLCGLAAAYTAINAVGRKWPTDSGLRLMAKKTVEDGNRDEQSGVTEQNMYLFLSECALGFKPFAKVFAGVFEDPDEFFAAPFFLTINLLATFLPEGQTVWEFLDVIEDAYEKAWLLDLNLLPALMVRARMPQPEQTPNARSAGQ
jgi:hypothetical protein